MQNVTMVTSWSTHPRATNKEQTLWYVYSLSKCIYNVCCIVEGNVYKRGTSKMERKKWRGARRSKNSQVIWTIASH